MPSERMRLWVALIRCPASLRLSIASSRTVSSSAMTKVYGRAVTVPRRLTRFRVVQRTAGRGILRGVSALDLGGRRWTMSRLLRVGDKVINLDNIEYITRDESNVVRIHFIHKDIELWNEQGEAFRQWVLSNAGYCEGSGEGW